MNVDTAHASATHPDLTQHTTPTHRFTIQLSATPRGARLARHLAAEQLDSWDWPYDTEGNQTAALLVAELATNAVRHGRERGRDFRLRLTLHPEHAILRIEVTDPRPDRQPPGPGTLRQTSPDAESGRGLLLVEALATHWGTTYDSPYSKRVWCDITLGKQLNAYSGSHTDAPHSSMAARRDS